MDVKAIPGFHVSKPGVHKLCSQMVFKWNVISLLFWDDNQQVGFPFVG